MRNTSEHLDERQEPSLPITHALRVVELAERWGAPRAKLLESAKLVDRNLADPSGQITVSSFESLVEEARRLTNEPALGFHLGQQMPITVYGFLGFAALSSSTVREAIDVAIRFAPLRTNALSLRLQVDGEVASLVIDEHASFGKARDVVILSFMVGLSRIGSYLVEEPVELAMELAFPEPDYLPRIAASLPAKVAFRQPANRLIFDAANLDQPLRLADPSAFRLALDQCERELDAVGGRDHLVSRARALLPKTGGGFSSIRDVATQLRVSVRTLKRHLAARGTTFSTLLQELRQERATLLLRSDLSIKEIATRLGYADQAGFTRAFRRWMGTSPRTFRRRVRLESARPRSPAFGVVKTE